MLVLTRKKNESIIIGNNIEIKVLKMGRNSVEIGISAPKSYSIFRKEVFDEIQEKNVKAIKSVEMGDLVNMKNLVEKIKKK